MFGLFEKSNPKLKFTKEYFKKLKKHVQGLELVFLKELEIKTKHDGKDLTHYLDNAYSQFVRDKKNKSEVINTYLKSALTLYQSQPQFSYDKIVPNIKDSRFIEEIMKIQQDEDIPYVFEKYNEELYVLYAQDTENSISYLIKDNIKEYNIETEGLQKRAIENLLKILPKIESHNDNGYYKITAGGDYEASLILDKTIWTKDNFQVLGEIVIGIPARDLVLLTGSEDVAGLKRLNSTVAERNRTGHHLVSK